MYWLRALFKINNIEDINFLINLYRNVRGELEIKQDENSITSIEWGLNPFEKIPESPNVPEYPFEIYARICGPDTIRAVSLVIDKLNIDEFQHANKQLILEWSKYIDRVVNSEMNRSNDICFMFSTPEKKLENLSELLSAIKLSANATHIIPSKTGFIITNPVAVYLSWVGLTSKSDPSSAMMFDKDDGFGSAFGGSDSIEYLNTRFELWKNSGYQGKMSDYYEIDN